jgi:serine/threonine protein kinase
MSPEQANGQTIDHRSDIFSTGIILYELLAGQRMFQGETMHIYTQVRDAVYEPLESLRPDLPANLHQVVQQALAKDPDERYQSGGEMLADLEECIYQLFHSDRMTGNLPTVLKIFLSKNLQLKKTRYLPTPRFMLTWPPI